MRTRQGTAEGSMGPAAWWGEEEREGGDWGGLTSPRRGTNHVVVLLCGYRLNHERWDRPLVPLTFTGPCLPCLRLLLRSQLPQGTRASSCCLNSFLTPPHLRTPVPHVVYLSRPHLPGQHPANNSFQLSPIPRFLERASQLIASPPLSPGACSPRFSFPRLFQKRYISSKPRGLAPPCSSNNQYLEAPTLQCKAYLRSLHTRSIMVSLSHALSRCGMSVHNISPPPLRPLVHSPLVLFLFWAAACPGLTRFHLLIVRIFLRPR